MGLMFDNIDLKAEFGFVTQEATGRGSPPVTMTELDMPDIDGAIELSRKAGVRRIRIRGLVYDNNPETARQKKDGLIRLITKAYSEVKPLKFPDTQRFLLVKLAGDPVALGPYGPIYNASVYEMDFTFEAREPWFFGESWGSDGVLINQAERLCADAPAYIASPRAKYIPNEPYLNAYGLFFGNVLGDAGQGMPENSEITFDTISGHTLFFEGAQGVDWDTSSAVTMLSRTTDATKDVMVVDLTAVGELPPPLKQKFGIAKADALDEGVLSVLVGDYHDGWDDEDFNITNNQRYGVAWDTSSALTPLQREVF